MRQQWIVQLEINFRLPLSSIRATSTFFLVKMLPFVSSSALKHWNAFVSIVGVVAAVAFCFYIYSKFLLSDSYSFDFPMPFASILCSPSSAAHTAHHQQHSNTGCKRRINMYSTISASLYTMFVIVVVGSDVVYRIFSYDGRTLRLDFHCACMQTNLIWISKGMSRIYENMRAYWLRTLYAIVKPFLSQRTSTTTWLGKWSKSCSEF